MRRDAPNYEIRMVSGGYRIWNIRVHGWWGDLFDQPPTELLTELNGLCRPHRVRALMASTAHHDRSPLFG